MSSISSGTTLTTALVQTADTSGVLQLQTNGGTTALTLDTSQNATFVGKVASASSLQLATNGTTTAVTIDTNQNVGLGVTPSAWGVGTGGHALEFSNAGSIWNYSNTTGINLSQNVYYNGAYYYKSTAAATLYGQGSGQHLWYNAPSGTAGNAITFTQAMTLDASGNWMVGSIAGESKANVFSGGSNGFSSGTLPPGMTLYGATTDGYGSMLSFKAGSGAQGVAGIGSFRVSGYQTDLRFYTNNTNSGNAFSEVARFDSSGNLLVGTTTSAGRLTVKGTTTDNSTTGITVQDSSANSLFYVRNDGLVNTGISTNSPYNATTASSANLLVTSSGSLSRATSALKYKQDVRNLENVDISIFRPVRYKSKCYLDNSTNDYIGFIADEYVDHYPELVSFGSEGQVEGFAYERMTAILCKAIQELSAQVTTLQTQVTALKG
jgi:hypothetical protein